MRLRLAKLGIFVFAWVAALALASLWTGIRPDNLVAVAGLFFGIKLLTVMALGSFDELWSHTSLEDLVVMLGGTLLATLILMATLAIGSSLASPRLALVDGALTLALLAPLRVAPRIYYELVRPRLLRRDARGVVLAGRAELIDLELRRMRRQPEVKERVAGLVIDGSPLVGALMHRVRVLGDAELHKLIAGGLVNEVALVAPASASFAASLQELCSAAHVPCRSAASLLALSDLLSSAEQLLDRPPVVTDDPEVARAIADRCVLVTGAGGSIGRELALQILRCKPRKLVLVNRGENALFHTERVLAAANRAGSAIEGHILDVRSETAVQRLFARHTPNLVFHAAAHKHVPLMERHPAEAVLNNVGGMRVVAEAAHGYGADGFVFISTDKAVHPTCVMGVTKRLGELFVRALATASHTRFMSVRFGNVLGSNGSVLPLFIEQVQRGGPVTVTHEGMTRYFMSIPEACRLVLCAATHGTGGELYVLDMGKATRIVDLAARVIERAGLRPHEDVPIVFCGPRPGEKLNEQLIYTGEAPRATATAGVWSVAVEQRGLEELTAQLDELLALAKTGDEQSVRSCLATLVSDFRVPGDHEDPDTVRIVDDSLAVV
jgi:FlaA1/EpsC-like NDP-sugar epimerase